eukprot:Seg2106.2 transcript_id=Seg2106.2/GoldUCD/mRNA.D3Y31 product="Centrosomal protein of 120 kDa" protein_id=Seg2106.2/GoldUCD/D3Y31
MMASDKVLLVVGIIEGKKFPKRPHHQILVEAKFDGEILSTDPVDHHESPDFTTELAWESDKKSFHQHRLQRTPIKLQCYAINTNDQYKEPIGYCVLDLRSVQMNKSTPQKQQWHTLLNSKYHGLKPELKVVISLEDESQKSTPQSQGFKQQSTEEEEKLEAVLDENEGHYLIGIKSQATHIFCLSITTATAKNLTQIIPSDKELKQQDGFYFFYKLLGNNVTSEPFFDAINPNFPAERASVRIFTNLQTLKQFIAKNSSLQFHFCSGETSLASTTISLLPILKDDIAKNSPSKIEGLFPLQAPQSNSSAQEKIENAALLGVSIVLKMESEEHAQAPSNGASPVLAGGGEAFVPEHPFSPQRPKPKSKDTQAKSADQPKKQRPELPKDKDPRVTKHPNRSLQFEDDSPSGSPKQDNIDHTKSRTKKEQRRDVVSIEMPRMNHYCYSIDLRSVNNLEIDHPINCFCRYSYPFFGSSAPILTSPAVEVRRNTEVLLPRSFCAFDFATTPSLIQQTLSRIPLMIEIWHRDAHRKDALFGVCQIDLSCVFSAEKIVVQGEKYRQIHSQVANILSPSSSKKVIGLLHVVLGLENFGEVAEQHTLTAIGTTQSLLSATTTENTTSESSDIHAHAQPMQQQQQIQQQQQPQQRQQQPQQQGPPREQPEYKAAIELELWKEQQEQAFTKLLQQKEITLMQTLAEEWKKRDKEREMIFQRKVDEYSKLEEKLRTSITDLERREKQVATNEAEVQRLKADMTREHEQKLSFLREASVRMKDDCDHRVELEKLKLQELKEQNQRYKEQIQNAEKRYKDKENEIMVVHEQLANRPESKMQAELSLALLEKVELERKLEIATKSKIHYKQQWGKALRELAKMKQSEQMAAKARLKKQERELEHMRLRYLAAEEKEIIKTEKEELANVKEQLQRLKESHVSSQPTPPQQQQTTQQATSNPTKEVKDDHRQSYFENRIAKLIEERDTLLRTGVYSTNDKIISELDRQIREAIADKDR